jgi:dTDP-4-dehydrorhamnose reductase
LELGANARAFSHSEVDICDRQAVQRAYAKVRPDVVFNCAAFHNVDACERQRLEAWQVNVDAVQYLAQQGVPLVHYSTNYVFDGGRQEPYGELDLPSPLSVYAMTKLAGEYAALAYGVDTLVIRTAGLYGLTGSAGKGGNFVQRMIARARQGAALKIVADQRLQPTFTADLASASVAAAQAHASGVVHLTAAESCSWFEFTQAIMEIAGIDASVEPQATPASNGVARRPLNGVLSRPRADRLALPRLRSWRDGLLDYMQRATATRSVVPREQS